jgi:hypothetical protein
MLGFFAGHHLAERWLDRLYPPFDKAHLQPCPGGHAAQKNSGWEQIGLTYASFPTLLSPPNGAGDGMFSGPLSGGF